MSGVSRWQWPLFIKYLVWVVAMAVAVSSRGWRGVRGATQAALVEENANTNSEVIMGSIQWNHRRTFGGWALSCC